MMSLAGGVFYSVLPLYSHVPWHIVRHLLKFAQIMAVLQTAEALDCRLIEM